MDVVSRSMDAVCARWDERQSFLTAPSGLLLELASLFAVVLVVGGPALHALKC